MSALIQTVTLAGIIAAAIFTAATIGLIIASLNNPRPRRRRPAGRWHRQPRTR
jgi:hypothetical protein